MVKENQIEKTTQFLAGIFNIEDNNERLEYLIKVLLSYKHGYEVWNRIFRKKIIDENKIRFCTECGDFGEDIGFVFKYFCYAKIIYCSEKISYHYYVHEGSIMDLSKAVIKLNELNEVCWDIEKSYYAVFREKKIRNQFPIIHFLIMNQQYNGFVLTEKYSELGSEIAKIVKSQWYRRQVKGLGRCYCKLGEYFGKKIAKQILLFSSYCLHKNWKRFSIDSLIFYKWVIKNEM